MSEKPNIKIKEVNGLETVLDFNQENEAWLLFHNLMGIRTGVYYFNEFREKVIYDFLTEYLHETAHLSPARKYHNKSPPDIDVGIPFKGDIISIKVKCEDLKIPEKDPVLGYTPSLNFEATPDSLKVTSCLERNGRDILGFILEDFLGSLEINGDGVDKPKIKFENEGQYGSRICIASLEQIPIVIKRMGELYQRIGDKRLEGLINLKQAIDHESGNPTAVEVLKQEYQERKNLLLPANRDF